MIHTLWFSQNILCCRKGVCVLVCKCHGHMEVRGQFLGVYLHHLFLRQSLSCLLLHYGLQASWPVSFWMFLGSLLPSFLRSAHHFGLSGFRIEHGSSDWKMILPLESSPGQAAAFTFHMRYPNFSKFCWSS